MPKVYFFDFDGVIIDSTRIKTDAFYELFLQNGEDVAQKIRSYHLKNQGVDRFKKIRYAFSDIMNLPCSDQTVEIYAAGFSKIVFDKILSCDFVPGALDFLRRLKDHDAKVFLLSATPDAELKEICKARDLEGLFTEICGSPISKPHHGERILREYNLAREDVIFWGDSASDLSASQALRVDFVGITYKNEYRFPPDVTTIPDFTGDHATKFRP